MAINSLDALIAALSAGRKRRTEVAKTTTPVHTATAGFHLMVPGILGTPPASSLTGTDLLWQSCWESGNGTDVLGIQHGGIVGPTYTKHLLNQGALITAAAGAPWQLKLVDLQGYYRLSGANVTGTGLRTLINANTFTASSSGGDLLLTYANDFNTNTKVRFTTTTTLPSGLSLATDYYLVRQSATTAKVATSLANALASSPVVLPFVDAGTGTHTLTIQMRAANGVGCLPFWAVVTAPTGGVPLISTFSYTNQAGTANRSLSATPVLPAAADAYATRVMTSGAASGRYGAFLPLGGADTGVQSVQSFTWSGGTAYTGSGVVALCVAKPIADIPLAVTSVWNERDYLNQLPSLPVIDDGACLALMLFAAGATTNSSPLTGALEFVWG